MDRPFRTRALLLGAVSLLLALLPALFHLIANGYWLGATVGEGRVEYLPTGLWDGVLLTLVLCLGAEILFFGAFFYPALKLGRSGVLAYLISNGAVAVYSSLIFVASAEPWSQSGWALIGLALVPLASVVLAIILAVLAVRRKLPLKAQRSVSTIRL